MGSDVGREPQYDVVADEFLDHARSGFYKRFMIPARLPGAAGRLAGKRVLGWDGGVRSGAYNAAELIPPWGAVVGFDTQADPRMVETAGGC